MSSIPEAKKVLKLGGYIYVRILPDTYLAQAERRHGSQMLIGRCEHEDQATAIRKACKEILPGKSKKKKRKSK